MHWNRNTANLWINLVRERILTLVEQEKMTNATNVQLDETYFTRTKEYFPNLYGDIITEKTIFINFYYTNLDEKKLN